MNVFGGDGHLRVNYLSVALVVPLLPGLSPGAGLARVHHPLALELAVSLVLLVWGSTDYSLHP